MSRTYLWARCPLFVVFPWLSSNETSITRVCACEIISESKIWTLKTSRVAGSSVPCGSNVCASIRSSSSLGLFTSQSLSFRHVAAQILTGTRCVSSGGSDTRRRSLAESGMIVRVWTLVEASNAAANWITGRTSESSLRVMLEVVAGWRILIGCRVVDNDGLLVAVWSALLIGVSGRRLRWSTWLNIGYDWLGLCWITEVFLTANIPFRCARWRIDNRSWGRVAGSTDVAAYISLGWSANWLVDDWDGRGSALLRNSLGTAYVSLRSSTTDRVLNDGHWGTVRLGNMVNATDISLRSTRRVWGVMHQWCSSTGFGTVLQATVKSRFRSAWWVDNSWCRCATRFRRLLGMAKVSLGLTAARVQSNANGGSGLCLRYTLCVAGIPLGRTANWVGDDMNWSSFSFGNMVDIAGVTFRGSAADRINWHHAGSILGNVLGLASKLFGIDSGTSCHDGSNKARVGISRQMMVRLLVNRLRIRSAWDDNCSTGVVLRLMDKYCAIIYIFL